MTTWPGLIVETSLKVIENTSSVSQTLSISSYFDIVLLLT